MKNKSSKVNKNWLHDHINDPWVKLATKEGYRARAVYKLREIDETLGLVRPGQLVVDLGAAPGAWSQYLRRRMGPGGIILALDLLPLVPIDGVTFMQGDFREGEMLERVDAAMAGRKADLVVSDMAPNLSGIASADAARITDLVELAIDFGTTRLKPDGALVAKAFHGSAYDALYRGFQANFRTVKRIKPKASRDKSSETFLVGLGLKAH